jgi:hypothetical protein
VLLAALIAASGGCHNLRNQLKALGGSDTTAATSTATARTGGGAPAAMPRPYGSKGPTAILNQTFHIRHGPSERDQGPSPSVPRFDWSGHGGRLGGAYGDGTGGRRQRGG